MIKSGPKQKHPVRTVRPGRGDLLKRIAAQMKRITIPPMKKR